MQVISVDELVKYQGENVIVNSFEAVPISVIEDIKAEIEQRIEMFVSAEDFDNAVTVRSILNIIDKHTSGER